MNSKHDDDSAFMADRHDQLQDEIDAGLALPWAVITAHTDDELKIIEQASRAAGRQLTEQEIRLSLDQARQIGELTLPSLN